MARRLEVELTSSRDDGTWTWRAAGAKLPKGELNASLLYDGAQVGDVCKVEAEFHLDGVEIIETFKPKAKKERSDILELISTPIRDDELVTEVKAKGPKGRSDSGRDRNRSRGDRKPRGDRPDSGKGRPDRKPRGDRKPREDQKPRPKRLRPKNVHRAAVMASVPDAQRPIADQVLAGGIPAVRAAIEKQNKDAAEGTPPVPAGPILKIAEDLMPKLRTAEWRDRAEAAVADMAELDLRDLRSVVVASDAGARDDETRALAATLKEGLAERIETDHAAWLKDLTTAVDDGRTVRALRLSSRPVKAGSPLPADMAKKLAEQASAALASDVFADRWATVLDAVAYSPLRNAITPAGYPAETNEEFMDAVRSVADRVPLIAGHYGIDPKEAAAAKKRRHAAAKARAKEGPKGKGRGRSKPRAEGGGSSERSPRSDRGERKGGGRDRDGGRGKGSDSRSKKKPRKDEPLEPGKAAQEARRLAAEAEAAAAAAPAEEAPEQETTAAPAEETANAEATESPETTEAEAPAEAEPVAEAEAPAEAEPVAEAEAPAEAEPAAEETPEAEAEEAPEA